MNMQWRSRARRIAVALVAAAALPCFANGSERGFFEPVPETERKWFYDCGSLDEGWLKRQCRGFKSAWYERRPMVLVSGYAWHDPNTYEEDNLEAFNSRPGAAASASGSTSRTRATTSPGTCSRSRTRTATSPT